MPYQDRMVNYNVYPQTQPSPFPVSSWQHRLLLGMIVLLALALRLWGIGWGLPYADHYHDEQTIARVALGMIERQDWNPRFFDYPSLYLYALRLVFDAHWRYGLATGLYTSVTQFPHKWEFYVTTPGFYLWGRALTATLGAATVALLALVGRRWWNVRVGLLAAALLAVLPFHIRFSQMLRVDVAVTLLTLLALGAALRLLQHADLWSYTLAGLAAGVAASTKYNAGAVFLAIIGAHIVRWRRASLGQSWRLLWAALASGLGFVAFTPYALLTPSSFLDGLQLQFADYHHPGPGDVVGPWHVVAYLRFFGTTGLGPLPALAAVLGIIVMVARRDRVGLVLLTFMVPYLLFFLDWPQNNWRNLLPLFPPLALCAAYGLDATITWLAASRPHPQSGHQAFSGATGERLGLLALTALVLTVPLMSAIDLDRINGQPDTRVQAATYIRHQLPYDTGVAVELSAEPWHGDPHVIPVNALTNYDANWYRTHGIRYLVSTSVTRTPDDQPAYDQLRAQTAVIQVFDNRPLGGVLGLAWALARPLAGYQTGVRVEVLDLGISHNMARG